MSRLNIVMTTDENYIIPTKVTLSSLLSSAKKDTNFDVYVLCAKTLGEINRDQLKKMEIIDERIKVDFLEVPDEQIKNAITTAHIPIASYYRLFISQLLNEERCLFIDGDMIIKEDLSEVYNTQMAGYYVAGVKDLGIQCNLESHLNDIEYLGIPSMENYVNAGFMLYNLKEIRANHLDKNMIEAIKDGYRFMDQDILNKFCYGKIKLLPLKYDFFTEYYESIIERKPLGYPLEDYIDIKNNIVVYHYTGVFKPWVCTRLVVNQIWWDEAKKVLDKDEYICLLNTAREFERKSDWSYILESIENKRNVVVFGFSEIGKMVASKLLKCGCDVKAFVDNDTNKVGCSYDNRLVFLPDEIIKKYDDPMFVVTSQNAYKQITTQLLNLGVCSNNIVRYILKDKTYYERLDKKFDE